MLIYQKGFTLLEIMIVLVIMGLLASIAVPSIFTALDRGNYNKIITDFKSIESALKIYRLDNHYYPTSDQGLEALTTKPHSHPIPPNWHSPYLDKLPTDPWRRRYFYVSPGENGQDYDLYTFGADGVRGGEDNNRDISVWQTTRSHNTLQ